MTRLLPTVLALLSFVPAVAAADEPASALRLQVEAGVLTTVNMELHGFQQPSATRGWRSVEPDLRLEGWYTPRGLWRFGALLQPVYAHYRAPLTSDLQYKGVRYAGGSDGELTYQFPTFRLTANYPVLGGTSDRNFLRLGLSAVARYAEVRFRAGDKKFTDTNLLGIPLLNFDAAYDLTPQWGLLASGDFLPAIDGNVFLDGLFDVFAGGRRHLEGGRYVDAGVRAFFGGYDPGVPEDYANRISFLAAVARYGW
jgi:hypothetical protein